MSHGSSSSTAIQLLQESDGSLSSILTFDSEQAAEQADTILRAIKRPYHSQISPILPDAAAYISPDIDLKNGAKHKYLTWRCDTDGKEWETIVFLPNLDKHVETGAPAVPLVGGSVKVTKADYANSFIIRPVLNRVDGIEKPLGIFRRANIYP